MFNLFYSHFQYYLLSETVEIFGGNRNCFWSILLKIVDLLQSLTKPLKILITSKYVMFLLLVNQSCQLTYSKNS
jgi:hypothetical protein